MPLRVPEDLKDGLLPLNVVDIQSLVQALEIDPMLTPRQLVIARRYDRWPEPDEQTPSRPPRRARERSAIIHRLAFRRDQRQRRTPQFQTLRQQFAPRQHIRLS